MKIEFTYKALIPTDTIVDGYTEIKNKILLELPSNVDINVEAKRYLSQYFSESNFQITEIKVVDRK